MKKAKKSGSALFMYCVIGLAFVLTVCCFTLYYGGFSDSKVVLWTAITAFTVMYHFWGRIIMGNVTKLFNINYRQWWFREWAFERRFYEALAIRKWRGKVLTYNPEAFSVENHTMEEIANTMAKAETDHWINEIISLTTLLFAIIWGAFPIFLITAIAAMLFDGQFIVVQRYNRPGVVKVIELQNKKRQKITV